MNPFIARRWSPYVVGVLIGLLNLACLYLVDKPLGASTSFVRTAWLIERQIDPEGADSVVYYAETMKLPPARPAPRPAAATPAQPTTRPAAGAVKRLDWQWMLVLGIFVGSLAASLLGRDFRLTAVPALWRDQFGGSVVKRWFWAFAAGALLLVGARLGDGCTSGHGLSGTMQLAVGSWVFTLCLFVGGIVVADLLYRAGPSGDTGEKGGA